MKQWIPAFFCAFFCYGKGMSQVSFDSLSHLSYQQLHNTFLNDVWGHTDVSGDEYALVGARKGVSIVDVSVPENPQEIYWIEGEESVWRDINTWNNYAYITTEAASGLLILDLNSLPDATGITSRYYTGPVLDPWQSAHTLYVDSAGYAYVFGANRGNGGVIILDIHSDPLNPVEVGVFDNWYCHDGYVLGDTMYLAHISDGFISLVDISDRSNPVLLGTQLTPHTFSHNIWTTCDGQFGFTTDEVSGAYVASYDLSDPQNIQELDAVQNSPGKGVIPHNVHYKDSFLVVSYYSDGVAFFDAQRPGNLVPLGNYDTYPGQTTGFDGCWASYPFLPSGIVLAADISEGLFVFRPHYRHAAYLEGKVTDQSTGEGVSGVEIRFTGAAYNEFSRSNGDYATGTIEGTWQVTFFKVGYYPQTFQLNLTEGEVTVHHVVLVPMPKFAFKVIVRDRENNTEIIDAAIRVKGSLTEDEAMTNGLGEAHFELYYEETYTITTGRWSYRINCFSQDVNALTQWLFVYLDKGYEDDFTFDLGWLTSNTQASGGLWERGEPNPSSILSAPDSDSGEDCGENAYVTGNANNPAPDFDDVKKGSVKLYSPQFDLSDGSTPYLHYERWFFNYYGDLPYDDTLKIFITNGDTTVLLDYQASDTTTFYRWNKKSVYLPDYISLTPDMQLRLEVSDYDPVVNITEAGFDHFFMDSYDHYAETINAIPADFLVYPNPLSTFLTIGVPDGQDREVRITDLNGKLLLKQLLDPGFSQLDTSGWEKGVYFISCGGLSRKVIKM